MRPEYFDIAFHLLSAWLAGSLIGLERTFHGRPAGFRTHALVCLASALLMEVTVYQGEWLVGVAADSFRTDPTRMAQGIMTGIGFLGAGVVFKEGFSVRGLTTAASIWMTAALGVLFGIGFFYPAIIVTIMTFVTLYLFRHIEYRIPVQFYAHHFLRFRRGAVMGEQGLREMIGSHGFSVSDMSYSQLEEGLIFEYRMIINTVDKGNIERLAAYLRGRDDVVEFRISPSGE